MPLIVTYHSVIIQSEKRRSGTLLLGHASRATTEAWYLDRSQLSRPPLPPL